MITRFAAYRIAESFAGTKAVGNIDKFWPTGDTPKITVEPMTKERYDLIMNRYKKR